MIWVVWKNSAITALPAGADVLDAAEEGGQAVTSEAVADLLALFPAIDPAGLAHQREVLGDRREVPTDQRLQLAHTAVAGSECLHDLQTGLMRQRLDDLHLMSMDSVCIAWRNCQAWRRITYGALH